VYNSENEVTVLFSIVLLRIAQIFLLKTVCVARAMLKSLLDRLKQKLETDFYRCEGENAE